MALERAELAIVYCIAEFCENDELLSLLLLNRRLHQRLSSNIYFQNLLLRREIEVLTRREQEERTLPLTAPKAPLPRFLTFKGKPRTKNAKTKKLETTEQRNSCLKTQPGTSALPVAEHLRSFAQIPAAVICRTVHGLHLLVADVVTIFAPDFYK